MNLAADSKCTFCGRHCLEIQTRSNTDLFRSWTVKCGISLGQVLVLKSSDVNTKGTCPGYCLRCFQLVLDVDFFLNGIRRFESLLSSTTAKLQNIIREKRYKEGSVKEESGLASNFEEMESVGSDIPDFDLVDDQWTNEGEVEEEAKTKRTSKNARGNNPNSSTHLPNRPKSQHGKSDSLVFPCPFMECHRRYADQFTLSKHVHRKHSYQGKRSSCQFCGLTFKQGDDGDKELDYHETSHRDAEVPFSCVVSKCPSSFTNFQDLRRHVMENHEETILRCELCPGKFFRTFMTLKYHKDLVHAPKKEDEGLKCVHSGCSFIASTKSRLQNHVTTHRCDRPHMCDECGSTYKTLGTLKRHLFTHTGETPFKCKYCYKSFNMGHKLKNHEETHAPTLSYLCSECGKAFRSKKNLSQHTTFHCPTRVTTRHAPKRLPRQKRKHEGELIQSHYDNLILQPQGSDDLGLLQEDGQLHVLP